MRYLFVSDIHGKYDKLIEALNNANFNINTDTIVCLGDCFDRGADSYRVLEFLMNCPNRILVWGNHDLRLKDLLYKGCSVHSYDYLNGVLETMKSFCNNANIKSIEIGISIFTTDDRYRDRYKLLQKFFDECVFAVEWSDLVGTHAWIPVVNKRIDNNGEPIYKYCRKWRKANYYDWFDSTWSNTEDIVKQKVFIPNKRMIVGHWHTWRLRQAIENTKERYFSTFMYKNKLIAIDGCTNVKDGVVNVFTYETNEQPTFISPIR